MDPKSLDVMLEWSEGFTLFLIKGMRPKDYATLCPALSKISPQGVSSVRSLEGLINQYSSNGDVASLKEPLWLDMSHLPTKDIQPMLSLLNTRRGTGRSGQGKTLILQVPPSAIKTIQFECADLWSMRSGAVVDFQSWSNSIPEI